MSAEGNKRKHEEILFPGEKKEPGKKPKTEPDTPSELSRQLHTAVQRTNRSEVARLLDAKADVNSLDSQGRSTLHIACSAEREETTPIIHLLLERGADKEQLYEASSLQLRNLGWGRGKSRERGAREEIDHQLNTLEHAILCRNLAATQTLLAAKTSLRYSLARAARIGNLRKTYKMDDRPLKILLEAKASPENWPDTAMVYLWDNILQCQDPNETYIKILLARRANVNARNSNHRTPLLTAVHEVSASKMRLLLKAKAQVLVRDTTGKILPEVSPLEHFLESPQIYTYHILLFQKKVYTERLDDTTPLHRVANFGDPKTVLALLLSKASATIDALDAQGFTALGRAIQQGHRDIVWDLIEAKASLDGCAPHSSGERINALEYAKLVGKPELFNHLVGGSAEHATAVVASKTAPAERDNENRKNWIELLKAANRDDGRRVRELLQAKVPIPAEEKDPAVVDLMRQVISRRTNTECMLLLLQRKVFGQKLGDTTPLHIAAESADELTVQLILLSQPDPIPLLRARDAKGRTALATGIQVGCLNVVQDLIEARADFFSCAPNLYNPSGARMTALEWAVSHKKTDLYPYLHEIRQPILTFMAAVWSNRQQTGAATAPISQLRRQRPGLFEEQLFYRVIGGLAGLPSIPQSTKGPRK